MASEVGEVVAMGSRVRIRGVASGPGGVPGPEDIVTIAEDLGDHRLSPRTPLGRALIGRRAGDVVVVQVDAGVARFAILAVEPPPVSEETVRVGSEVTVQDGALVEGWRIVPHHEADPGRRLISEATPMARALLGHRSGDEVLVDRPSGRWMVTILSVSYVGS
jgi:transcription elongation GreA/GreB family factor